MQLGEAIENRRSIRKFQDKPVPRELVGQVLEAATLAPSGKNAQPWEFIVLEGAARDKLPELITAGAEKVEAMGYSSGSAKNSARILEESGVIIVVYNPNGKANEDGNEYHRAMRSVDTQSVGAAIENMLLRATELGLGSLWICDVFFARAEIDAWLQRDGELMAAVALGWPGESPGPRPRKSWQEVTTWKE